MGQTLETFGDAMSSGMLGYQLSDETKKMEKIFDITIEEQSKYADIVTRTNAIDEGFAKSQLHNGSTYCYDSRANNPTSIGNVAWMALHAPSQYKKDWVKMDFSEKYIRAPPISPRVVSPGIIFFIFSRTF